MRHNHDRAGQVSKNAVCSIIGDPNFNLTKSTSEPYSVGNIIDYTCVITSASQLLEALS